MPQIEKLLVVRVDTLAFECSARMFILRAVFGTPSCVRFFWSLNFFPHTERNWHEASFAAALSVV